MKIYFSKISNPEEFCEGKSYFFPFAEKLCYYSIGKKAVFLYIWIRVYLEELFHE